MKKIIFLAVLAVFAASCATSRSAQTGTSHNSNSDLVIVEGVWHAAATEAVNLYAVENGALRQIASSAIDPQSRFHFAFVPETEGFYVIGTSHVYTPRMNNNTFYFKPGDRLTVEIEGGGGRMRLLGDGNSPENMELARWNEFIRPLADSRAGNYMRFSQLLEEKADSFRPQFTGNETFNAAFANLRKLDLIQNALLAITSPRSGGHPGPEDFPAFYRNIDLWDITGAELLGHPYGIRILQTQIMALPQTHSGKFTEGQLRDLRRSAESALDVVLPMIQNEVVKGELVALQIARLDTMESYLDFEQRYGQYLVTPSQQERFRAQMKNIPTRNEAGQPAIDFRFPDTEGIERALSDFRGKVVYIDVWATWCGPCLAEVPSLIELEAEYRGRDVVFMGVSVDRGGDHGKWLEMVAEKELKGVQLFAGDRAREVILDPYAITGIPRFILVDRAGNLITSDAPRPSSRTIRPMLNRALE